MTDTADLRTPTPAEEDWLVRETDWTPGDDPDEHLMWWVTRDGGLIEGPFLTEARAFGHLLALQPMSVDWATTHEGWSLDRIPPTPLTFERTAP